MAKQERARITREAIVQAAGTIFAETTYSAATLSDVIGQAGVTQGALYFHFDSKHQLALEVIRRQHDLSIGAGNEVLALGGPGVEGMIRLSAELARQITTDPIVRGGLRLTTESPELFPEFASKPYLDWISACEGFLNRAIGEGDVKVGDASQAARFIIGSFTGVQAVSQALTGWADIYERLEEMWGFVLQAVVVPDRHRQVLPLAALVRPETVD